MKKNRLGSFPALLIGILLLTVLVHLPTLNQPFGRDQGIFAYIGDGILQGYVPYRDAWDHKPPGIDFSYALAFAVFGRSMISVHLLELAGVLLTAVTLSLLGRRFLGSASGLIAALLYGLGSALMFEWWDRGQAEFFMTLPVVLSLYCVTRSGILDSRSTPAPVRLRDFLLWLGASSLFAGFSLYFKPTAGVMLAFLAVLLLAGTVARRAIRQGVLGMIAMAIGALLSLVPLLSYFALNGALGDLYESVFLFNTYHVQTGANLTLAQMVTATLDFGARMGFLAPLGALGAIFMAMRRHAGGMSVALWFVFLAAGVWVQGKFFSYHWSTLLAPLALLASAGIAFMRDPHPNPLPEGEGNPLARPFAVTTLSIIMLPLLLFSYMVVLFRDQAPKLGRDLPYFLRQTSEQAYLDNFGHNLRGVDVYSFTAARATASYLSEHTDPQDTVLVWGFQALVNFLADRRAPTRYVFNYPVTIDQPDSDLRAKARKTFMEDLRRNKPKYIVLVTNDVNPLQAVDSFSLLQAFPEFKSLVDGEYGLEKDIADFHIYKRKAAP